jgi:hypothetical protein
VTDHQRKIQAYLLSIYCALLLKYNLQPELLSENPTPSYLAREREAAMILLKECENMMDATDFRNLQSRAAPRDLMEFFREIKVNTLREIAIIEKFTRLIKGTYTCKGVDPAGNPVFCADNKSAPDFNVITQDGKSFDVDVENNIKSRTMTLKVPKLRTCSENKTYILCSLLGLTEGNEFLVLLPPEISSVMASCDSSKWKDKGFKDAIRFLFSDLTKIGIPRFGIHCIDSLSTEQAQLFAKRGAATL